ncbi:MAG: hypothetical protein AAB847_02855 [Patescibacteria group bacterium]
MRVGGLLSTSKIQYTKNRKTQGEEYSLGFLDLRSDRRVVEDLLGVNQATNDARADEDSGEHGSDCRGIEDVSEPRTQPPLQKQPAGLKAIHLIVIVVKLHLDKRGYLHDLVDASVLERLSECLRLLPRVTSNRSQHDFLLFYGVTKLKELALDGL